MAEKQSYPKVPAGAWTTLRDKASSAPTTKITGTLVAVLLGMANEKSARDNIVGPIRRMGLIDENGALTDRGHKWRNDASYADACQEILDEIYPADLAALTDSEGKPDVVKLKAWFAHRGYGESNASSMARTYALVASKEIPDPSTAEVKPPPAKKVAAAKKTNQQQKPAQSLPAVPPAHEQKPSSNRPDVHLDIQIHIAADAPPDQIDHIFSSMAKHLYSR